MGEVLRNHIKITYAHIYNITQLTSIVASNTGGVIERIFASLAPFMSILNKWI